MSSLKAELGSLVMPGTTDLTGLWLQLLHFALEGWHSHEPMPFYQAPNSLVGRLLIGPMIM